MFLCSPQLSFFPPLNALRIPITMPRYLRGAELAVAMEGYREAIITSRQAGTKIDDILAVLNEEEHIKIGRAKLYEYLKAWDAQIQRPPLTDDQKRLGVLPLARSTLQSDTQIASNLAGQLGIDASRHQVKRARLQYRAIKRFPNPVEREQHRLETHPRIEELVHRGGGLLHGRQWAVSHLRRHEGFRAFRDDVAAAQQEVDP